MRYSEILAEASSEAGIIKPKKPLTPAQSDREAKRKSKIQGRIQDVRSSSAQKLKDLSAELTK